jgi:hypothetical protein
MVVDLEVLRKRAFDSSLQGGATVKDQDRIG